MRIYNFYNDIMIILLYEILCQTYPIWCALIVRCVENLIYRRKKNIYINSEINFIELKPVAITIGEFLIFLGLININRR